MSILIAVLDVAQRIGWPPLLVAFVVAFVELMVAAHRSTRPAGHARFWSRPRPHHILHAGAHCPAGVRRAGRKAARKARRERPAPRHALTRHPAPRTAA